MMAQGRVEAGLSGVTRHCATADLTSARTLLLRLRLPGSKMRVLLSHFHSRSLKRHRGRKVGARCFRSSRGTVPLNRTAVATRGTPKSKARED